jgi:phosphate starvation-inducible PhoH-like protein
MLEAKNLNKEISIKKIDKETSNIKIFNNNILMAIVGEFNKNLNKIEKLTNTKLFFRGNSITVKGDEQSILAASNSLTFLVNKYLVTNSVENDDIIYSIKNGISEDMKENKNNIRSIDQVIKTPRRSVIPRSKKQSDYLKALLNENVVMSLGPAGTGKSYLAVSVAVNMLMEKKVEKVILSRPAVEAGERLGFLPGDLKEKVDPYLRPLYDALYDLFGFEKVQRKIETGEIEIAPLAFMRGRTLKNSFAILDEAQNASLTQIKMFLTRIGENSKLVVNGDPSQIDLLNKSHSGLIQSTKILKNVKEIKCIKFDHNDVVRHPLVSKIIQAYNHNSNDKN